MHNARTLFAIIAVTVAVGATACGGDDATSAPTATTTRNPSSTTATAGTPSGSTTPALTNAGASTSTPATTPRAAATSPAPDGRVYNAAQAKTIIDAASLTPADLEAGWTIMTDNTTDNAAAAAADPTIAGSIERCGRLSGRVVTNQPPELVSAYITGLAVSYFSQITVYATATGAADCAAEAAVRLQEPAALARAFGNIFTDPAAVTVQVLEYPQTADGSFAAALTGDINASGTVVQLQIIIVAFRTGNVSAVVGTAASPLTTPTTAGLPKYVDLVLDRINANQ